MMKVGSVLAVLFSTNYFILPVFCEILRKDDGSFCSLEKDKVSCPSGTRELYRDVGISKICCEPDTKAERLARLEASACRASKCVSEDDYYNDIEPVICSSSKYLTSRFLSDGRLEYENLLEGQCSNRSDGSTNGISALCCPQNSTNEYLVTDFGVESNEFPHMAKLETPTLCGATVYNKRFLITAAHCVVDSYDGNVKPVEKMKVTLAPAHLGKIGKSEYVYKVKRAIPHEKYSKSKGSSERDKGYVRQFNDVALVELDRDIKFGDGVKSLKISNANFLPSNQAVVVGWGQNPKNYLWTWLQKQNFLLRRDSDCFDLLKGYYWTMDEFKEQLMCVGGILKNTWSPIVGMGDHGSPVICREKDGLPVLCGVVSYGPPHQRCLDSQEDKNCPPSVAVDVAYFSKWIRNVAGEQSLENVHKPCLYGNQVNWQSLNKHQVQISSKTGKLCGGTLIAKNLVVTAAHCVFRDEWTYLGEPHENLKSASANGQVFEIIAAEKMPGFKKVWPRLSIELAHDVFAARDYHKLAVDYWHKQDIAVVKLSENVEISKENIPELILEDQVYIKARELAFERDGGNQLMERNFKILSEGDCQRRLNRLRQTGLRATFENDVMCGIETYSGGSTCDRSLGGGLICRGNGDKLVLCGVQVFRLCERSYPNLFIDLGNLVVNKWVRQAISKLSAL